MFEKSVETSGGEFVEIFTVEGEVVLMLAAIVGIKADEVDHLEARHLDKSQVDALIKALQEAKEALG